MSDPTALITGGTSGIGRATALLLDERGYRVMVTGLDGVDDHGLPPSIVAVRADTRSSADTDRVIREVRDHLGSLNVLFLNAGVSRPGPIETIDEAAFDTLFDVNVKGTFFMLQRALPVLEDGASVVVTVGAGEGLGSAMTAAKGALVPLVRAAAIELAPRRIRVNAVSPGLIDTPAYASMGVPRDVVESWAEQIPHGRIGTPADIAETVAFLASDAAGYITGQNISVSGGIGLSTRP